MPSNLGMFYANVGNNSDNSSVSPVLPTLHYRVNSTTGSTHGIPITGGQLCFDTLNHALDAIPSGSVVVLALDNSDTLSSSTVILRSTITIVPSGAFTLSSGGNNIHLIDSHVRVCSVGLVAQVSTNTDHRFRSMFVLSNSHLSLTPTNDSPTSVAAGCAISGVQFCSAISGINSIHCWNLTNDCTQFVYGSGGRAPLLIELGGSSVLNVPISDYRQPEPVVMLDYGWNQAHAVALGSAAIVHGSGITSNTLDGWSGGTGYLFYSLGGRSEVSQLIGACLRGRTVTKTTASTTVIADHAGYVGTPDFTVAAGVTNGDLSVCAAIRCPATLRTAYVSECDSQSKDTTANTNLLYRLVLKSTGVFEYQHEHGANVAETVTFTTTWVPGSELYVGFSRDSVAGSVTLLVYDLVTHVVTTETKSYVNSPDAVSVAQRVTFGAGLHTAEPMMGGGTIGWLSIRPSVLSVPGFTTLAASCTN